MMKNSKYRRQFIFTRHEVDVKSMANWRKTIFAEEYFVYTQKDLEITKIIEGDNEVVLLGYIIDSHNPKYSNEQILKELIFSVTNFSDIEKEIMRYSGRWIILYKSNKGTFIFNDPCALRQVYFTTYKQDLYLASQPHLLAEILEIEKDEDKELNRYLQSDYYSNQENPWYGDKTEYIGVYHLLPNHFLNTNNKRAQRFNKIIETFHNQDEHTIVKRSSLILEGSIQAIVNRNKTMLAVTAGLDSRLLLAASRSNKSQILYYVSTKNVLSKNHMDIKIPRKLSSILDLNLKVLDNLPKVRKDFLEVLKKNVSRARFVPKTLTIQYFYDNYSDYININGNASGICKNAYGNKNPNNQDITSDYIMKKIDCPPELLYVRECIENWLVEAKPYCIKNKLNLMDLFYWEQRMGNWGAMYPSEQDIAIDEFTPFSNRELISLLLNSDESLRCEPHYLLYRNIAKEMWPDTLSVKINPLDFKTASTTIFKKVLTRNMIVKLKSIRSYITKRKYQ